MQHPTAYRLPAVIACALCMLAGCQYHRAHDHDHAADTPAATVEVLVEDTRSWDGSTLPAYPDGQPQVTILRITVQPHSRLPVHLHPGINAGVLLSGRIVVHKQDGTTRTVEAGEALIEVVDTWHYGENPTDEVAEIIVFYAGRVGQDITVTQDPDAHDH